MSRKIKLLKIISAHILTSLVRILKDILLIKLPIKLVAYILLGVEEADARESNTRLPARKQAVISTSIAGHASYIEALIPLEIRAYIIAIKGGSSG